ncbi:uncharacterized protein TNCT_327151 [Trichonephila clavata]|uniref:Uncharacterized protein n=1 Tax=Trichonephila clavata TaxID=2740835 RepID=A0A8X6LAM2_TRICU|nr:uncharacterized protein TNCT_327151 [Trichonephila clavata]
MEWRRVGSPTRQKIHQNPSPVKLIVIVTYDVMGIIVCHFVPHGKTVTVQYYRDFLVRQVRLVDSAIILHFQRKTR